MNRLVTNRAALRYSDGREYLVCPAVMIRPGVLSANNGAILYGERLLKDRPGRWDGVPLTLGHPKDVQGNPVSAADARGFIIGHVAGVRYARGGLRGEAWFDIERTPAGVLEKIDGGGPLEISTGLYTETVPVGGFHRGRRFTKRLTNFTPDHLAVLTDAVGACSVADGCGLVMNAAGRLGGFQPTGGRCGCGCGRGRGIDIPPHREPPLGLPDAWSGPAETARDERPARPAEGGMPAEPPLPDPQSWRAVTLRRNSAGSAGRAGSSRSRGQGG